MAITSVATNSDPNAVATITATATATAAEVLDENIVMPGLDLPEEAFVVKEVMPEMPEATVDANGTPHLEGTRICRPQLSECVAAIGQFCKALCL